MTIKLVEDVKYPNPTLKFSKLAPFEYIIMAKDMYAEAITGPGKKLGADGKPVPWHKFQVRVFEYKTVNDMADKIEFKDAEGKIAGYFANTPKIAEKINALPLNVKFKVYATQGKSNDGKAFTEYKVETLDKIATGVTNKSPTPSVDLDAKIKAFKKSGVKNVEDVIPVLLAEYETSAEIIRMRWNEL